MPLGFGYLYKITMFKILKGSSKWEIFFNIFAA